MSRLASILMVALLMGLLASAAVPLPAAQQTVSAAVSEEDAPVPVQSPSEKAISYHQSGNVLWFVDLAWGFVIPLLLLFSGLSSRIRSLAQKMGRKWFFTIAIYYVIFSIILFLISLPLSYYEEFARQHAYGLSNQTVGKWLADSFKGLMVGSIMGCLFLWVPYLLLRRSPRRWWLYSSILLVPFLFFIMLIGPVWIDPLFNDFGPMKNKALEGEILSLAHRTGIEGGRVFEVNKSVDTKTVSAYVSGFLGTKRIVLWDTLLARLSDREVLVVMAHEMGHYVLNHVIQSILFISFVILVTLYLAHRVAGGLIARYKERWGFDQLSDIASLPLLMLLMGVFTFLLSPVFMGYSRYQEHEADRFALEITRSNRAAAMAFVKLQEENLAVPRPGLLYKLWRSSHPPIGERIDFCNEYKPWKAGQPLKYSDKFR